MADWRLGKTSLTSKLKFYWDENCESLGDVTFIVGPDEEKIKGFKFPLILMSPVFEAMFNMTWSSSRGQNESIELPHTDPTVFRHFLRFLLMDDLTIAKVASLNLSMTQVIEIYYLSKEYLDPHLEQTTKEYIENNIRVETVLEIYENVRGKDAANLELDTFNFIMTNLPRVIQQDEFLTLSKDLLMTILSSISSDVNELSLFQATWRWAEAQSLTVIVKDEENRKNIVRQLVRDILPEIRLPLLTPKEFDTHVRPTGVLDGAEAVAIYDHLASIYDKGVFRFGPTLQLSDTAFNNLYNHLASINDEKVFRLGQTLRLSDGLSVKTGMRSLDQIRPLVLNDVGTSPDSKCRKFGTIWLKTSKTVAINGVGFFGPLYNDSQYEVEVLIRRQDFSATTVVKKVISARKGSIFYVTLHTPFIMESETFYFITFWFRWGVPTGRKVMGLMSGSGKLNRVIQDDVTFEYFQCSSPLAQVLYSPVV